MNKTQLSIMLASAAMAASAIFIPIYALERGINYFGIGLIQASLAFGTILSYYFFGVLSDSEGKRMLYVKFGYFVSSIAVASQFAMNSLVSFILIQFLVGISAGIYFFPLFSLAANSKDYKKNVSSLSAYSALGSFFGYFIATILTSVWQLFAVSTVLLMFAFWVSLKIPDVFTPKKKVNLIPINLIKKEKFIYLTNFLRHIGANFFWAVLIIYLLGIGASKTWIAIISAINPLGQFFFMRFEGELASKNSVSEKRLIILGTTSATLVFIFYLFIPNLWFTLPIAFLTSFAWSGLSVGSNLLLTSRNAEKASAGGLLGSILGFSRVLGLAIGGLIAQVYGIDATLFLSIIFCSFSVITATFI